MNPSKKVDERRNQSPSPARDSSSSASSTSNLDKSSTPATTLGPPESLQLRPRVIHFNIMVAGLSGLGKTTLCSALLESWQQEETTRGTTSKRTINKSTKTIDESRVFERYDPQSNTVLKVRIIDTPGFGNRVNHRNSDQPILEYIEKCRARKYSWEMSSRRRDDDHDDPLVHVCLYFLSPGRFLAIDRHFLKSIQKQLTIVPLIAKADTLTDDEIAQYRAGLQQLFKQEHIQVYNFDTAKKKHPAPSPSGSSQQFFRRGRRPGELLAIVSRDGVYPWGHACALDPNHSDLTLIRDFLLAEHTERFLELASEHYTLYRSKHIRKQKLLEALKYVCIIGLAAVQVAGRITNDSAQTHPLLQRLHGVLLPIQSLLVKARSRKESKPSPIPDEEDTDTTVDLHGDKKEERSEISPNSEQSSSRYRVLGLFGTPNFDTMRYSTKASKSNGNIQ